MFTLDDDVYTCVELAGCYDDGHKLYADVETNKCIAAVDCQKTVNKYADSDTKQCVNKCDSSKERYGYLHPVDDTHPESFYECISLDQCNNVLNLFYDDEDALCKEFCRTDTLSERWAIEYDGKKVCTGDCYGLTGEHWNDYSDLTQPQTFCVLQSGCHASFPFADATGAELISHCITQTMCKTDR